MLRGPRRHGCPRREAELRQDVLHVSVGGPNGNDELIGDFAVRQTASQQSRNLKLTFGEHAIVGPSMRRLLLCLCLPGARQTLQRCRQELSLANA